MENNQFKDIITNYLDTWLGLVSSRTKLLFSRKEEKEIVELKKSIEDGKKLLEKTEAELMLKSFQVVVPYRKFAENMIDEFTKLEERNRVAAAIEKKGDAYEKLVELNALFKFLRETKKEAVDLNLLVNLTVDRKHLQATKKVFEGSDKKVKVQLPDNANELLASLYYTYENGELVVETFPMIIEVDRQKFVVTAEEHERLKELEERMGGVLRVLQEQIALNNIGKGDNEVYSKMQGDLLDIKEERNGLVSEFIRFGAKKP